VLQKPALKLVGAVDIDPEKAGRDLGDVCRLGRKLGLVVNDDLKTILTEQRPAVAIHTTVSFLDSVHSELATILRAGVHVVSSCEELFYPYHRDQDFCLNINRVAESSGAALVGTGVNPGFVMDLLPLCLTGICLSVDKMRLTRVVDTGRRRPQLARKTGAGLSQEEFERLLSHGKFGHIGLRESAVAVMDTLGWPADRIDEEILPVLARKDLAAEYVTVTAGQVAGLHQVMTLTSQGVRRLILDLWMYVGAEDAHDAVEIEGEPSVSLRIPGGVFGDPATVAALVNTVPKIVLASPGLRTMMELPVPHILR
jgi:4-hydroxy-tetrahydrodipicolinate reductase